MSRKVHDWMWKYVNTGRNIYGVYYLSANWSQMITDVKTNLDAWEGLQAEK